MQEYMALLGRLALGAVFLTAGLGKQLDRRDAAQRALEDRLLPPGLARIHGLALPWFEMTTGLLLLLSPLFPPDSPLRTLPVFVAGGVLTVFTAAVAIALARGWDVDCHCFGRFGSGGRLTGWSLGRNLALLTLAAVVFFCERTASPTLAGGAPALGVMPVLLLDLAVVAITAMAVEASALGGAARRAGYASRAHGGGARRPPAMTP